MPVQVTVFPHANQPTAAGPCPTLPAFSAPHMAAGVAFLAVVAGVAYGGLPDPSSLAGAGAAAMAAGTTAGSAVSTFFFGLMHAAAGYFSDLGGALPDLYSLQEFAHAEYELAPFPTYLASFLFLVAPWAVAALLASFVFWLIQNYSRSEVLTWAEGCMLVLMMGAGPAAAWMAQWPEHTAWLRVGLHLGAAFLAAGFWHSTRDMGVRSTYPVGAYLGLQVSQATHLAQAALGGAACSPYHGLFVCAAFAVLSAVARWGEGQLRSFPPTVAAVYVLSLVCCLAGEATTGSLAPFLWGTPVAMMQV